MKSREYKYLKAERKWLPKKLGVASWTIPMSDFQHPNEKSSYCLMMPGSTLTHADGTPVEIDPIYRPETQNTDPHLLSDWMNAHWSEFGKYEVFEGRVIRTQPIAGHVVHSVTPKEELKKIFEHQGKNDERSVATDA